MVDTWDLPCDLSHHVSAGSRTGKFLYFSNSLHDLGYPPNWDNNLIGEQATAVNIHWSKVSDTGNDDIKVIWEPSRFRIAYDLARTYMRTGNCDCAETFWQLIESWRIANPPNCGANWKCGQEISIRVMAWCFGLYVFLNASATTSERISTLVQMIAASGYRIEANLTYALSQNNNHGISEAMGLWTIGSIFPELKSAIHWEEKGRRVLERLGRELIYNDGSFSQHSLNYHRLMLHDYLWALRLGDILGNPFSDELKGRVAKAGSWLYQLQDPETGRVPCYGANDGSLVLPLNNCDYQDFRPVVQAVHYYSTGMRCFPDGPWDEDLLWLFGPQALKAPVRPPERTNLCAQDGGYYTLRAKKSFAFVRCASFRHRPSHADMLHMDLWWRGQNIACDAGTYSYNAPAPWDSALANTAVHNTVTVDDLDQMNKVSRFLWLPWLKSKVRSMMTSSRGQFTYWQGQHDGYRRLKAATTHCRAIMRIGDEVWLVLDDLSSPQAHQYRLHWLLMDAPYEWQETNRLLLTTRAGPYTVSLGEMQHLPSITLVRADEHTTRGWRSPYYNDREPALSLDCTVTGSHATFWTLFAPSTWQISRSVAALQLNSNHDRVTIMLSNKCEQNERLLVTSLDWQGTVADHIDL